MMAGNGNLAASRAGRTDEFYTRYEDIESELGHYVRHFTDKVVYCNCDDPARSNFWKYFSRNFARLGLAGLVATYHVPGGRAYKTTMTRGPDGVRHGTDRLEGDGDFRSGECVGILDGVDVVVTNAPFSLMREFLPMLVRHGRKFVVLGNLNHVTYREVKPLVLDGTVWLGHDSGHFWFRVPSGYEAKGTDYRQDADGQKWRRMGNSCWFTNLDIVRRHEPLPLSGQYSPGAYPRYDDFDAIEVGRTRDIPADYFGKIGVPVTYLPYHCPDQFEILDLVTPSLGGRKKYKRLIIRRR